MWLKCNNRAACPYEQCWGRRIRGHRQPCEYLVAVSKSLLNTGKKQQYLVVATVIPNDNVDIIVHLDLGLSQPMDVYIWL